MLCSPAGVHYAWHPTMDWTVYIIRCDDGTLYTGITTDLARRLGEHSSGPRGARYFNGRNPMRIEYSECGHSRSTASRRESEIKRLSRTDKLRLIAAGAPPGPPSC